MRFILRHVSQFLALLPKHYLLMPCRHRQHLQCLQLPVGNKLCAFPSSLMHARTMLQHVVNLYSVHCKFCVCANVVLWCAGIRRHQDVLGFSVRACCYDSVGYIHLGRHACLNDTCVSGIFHVLITQDWCPMPCFFWLQFGRISK